MIGVIFGEKGTGKTKRLLQHANRTAADAKGSVVFIDDDNSYMFDLSSAIRFINAAEYGIETPKMLYGFLNFVRHDLASLEGLFADLTAFSEKHGVNIVMSVSGNADMLPPFMREMVLQIT